MALEEKIDALICAIHMLVGQMQAEREVAWCDAKVSAAWQAWNPKDLTDVGEEDPGIQRCTEALQVAQRKAAGLRGDDGPH